MPKGQKKICPKGHIFFKASDCISCPKCAREGKPESGFLSQISAPARRAMIAHQITEVAQLIHKTKKEVAGWHGVGPRVLAKLEAALVAEGLHFQPENKIAGNEN